jgi:nitrogen fixation/metabolism regulation signal transduction histidine kinase
MSIRLRLIAICVVVAVLPAVPVTLLVRNLIEKSFNVGLSTTVSDALESGMAISRSRMIEIQTEFEREADRIVGEFGAGHFGGGIAGSGHLGMAPADSARMAAALSPRVEAGAIDGYVVGAAGAARPGGASGAREQWSEYKSILDDTTPIERRPHAAARAGLAFYETRDKAVQVARWHPDGASREFVLYKRVDPAFLADARKLLDARQIFAQLRLAQGSLSRSFFYPFIIIYGVMLAVALLLALFMAERMAAPVRRLAAASAAVAAGDWRIRVRGGIGGEIGRLTEAFNLMVSRLDTQRRRLIDLEKMAAWREIARHLAHEIKNPLLPIRLAVQEMRDQYKGEDASYRGFLSESSRVVEDELEHLQRLVREFSAFAKMPGLAPAVGSLEHLAADVSKLYPNVETRIEAAPDLPEFPFDHDQMRRVLVNLFENAADAAGEKAAGAGAAGTAPGAAPASAAPAVTMDMKRAGENAILTFADNGPGIPEEHLPRIFDPYFTTRRTGTGLGLALVKSIVLMHGGTIEARNAAAGGAVFTMTLPLAGPPAGEADTRTQGE